jgi:hypothetical protein
MEEEQVWCCRLQKANDFFSRSTGMLLSIVASHTCTFITLLSFYQSAIKILGYCLLVCFAQLFQALFF